MTHDGTDAEGFGSPGPVPGHLTSLDVLSVGSTWRGARSRPRAPRRPCKLATYIHVQMDFPGDKTLVSRYRYSGLWYVQTSGLAPNRASVTAGCCHGPNHQQLVHLRAPPAARDRSVCRRCAGKEQPFG